MANLHKGEVELPIKTSVLRPKNGRLYLKLGFNAICEAEADFPGHRSIIKVIDEAEKDPTSMQLNEVRILLYHALRAQFPEIRLQDAGDIMEGVETEDEWKLITTALGEALTASFPKGMRKALVEGEGEKEGGDTKKS